MTHITQMASVSANEPIFSTLSQTTVIYQIDAQFVVILMLQYIK